MTGAVKTALARLTRSALVKTALDPGQHLTPAPPSHDWKADRDPDRKSASLVIHEQDGASHFTVLASSDPATVLALTTAADTGVDREAHA